SIALSIALARNRASPSRALERTISNIFAANRVGIAQSDAANAGSAALVAACAKLSDMDLMTLTEIRRAAQSDAVQARVHVQVETAAPRLTREQKTYCELVLA